MPFLKNAWYAAAWSHEVESEPFRRVLLNEPVVMFRKRDGEAVAFTNICPHRFAPLHLGVIVNDTIECPYHGLRYNTEGVCVFNPDGDGRVPPGARLKNYPLLERYGTLWIWMGEGAADASKLPDFEFLTDTTHYRPLTGLIEVNADYRFLLDNLLDIAHIAKLHHDTLASEAITRSKTEVVEKGDAIWVNRWCPNGPLRPDLEMMWSRDRGSSEGIFDQWVRAGWHAPSMVTNDLAVTLAGQPIDAGLNTMAAHFLTPETESRTHYFWALCRNFRLDDEEFDRLMSAGSEHVFVEQDERMLRAIQEQVGGKEFWSMRPMLLHADQGPIRVRKTLERMITAESAARLAPEIPTTA